MQTLHQTQGHTHVALKPSLSQSSWDHEREFIEAMRLSGINFKGNLLADGTIHRFAPEGKGDKDGWYVFYGMAGAFGNWSQDIHQKWSLRNQSLSYEEKSRLSEQIEKTKRASEEERNQRHEEASSIALTEWKNLLETGTSPYLERKKVDPFGVHFRGELVVVPLKDTAGKLWSLQYISPDGTKRFLSGGHKKGCFHHIGALKDGEPIIVAEGYATGASVYMATNKSVVVAFDAGNLDPVIEQLKKVYPKSPIIIAGDDDRWKDHNTGREKAEQVAHKHGCAVIFPQFKNTEEKPTDFNDLHVLEGSSIVKEQLEQATQPCEWPEPKPIRNIKKDLYPVVPLPSSLIPEPYQAWLVDIAERMQCPLDYVAVGAVIVTSSIIGAGCSIRPKRLDSWEVLPNLWGGVVGAPSTLKSPSLKEIMRPLEYLEAEARDAYEKELHNHFVEIEAYKASKEVIKKEMMKAARLSDRFALDQAKEKLRSLQEPQPPICKRYSTNDVTIEKMHELLSRNSRGLLFFRDELMGLLAGWDKEGHEADRAFYLETWNGYGSGTADRISRGSVYTKNLCVSLLGTTQPCKLLSYFQHTLSGVANDGLLQRFQLLVYPDELKKWDLVDRKPDNQARDQASSIMIKLANMNFTHHGAILGGQSETPYFHFDTQAQDIFYEWLTEHENRIRNSHDEPIIIEHLTKYRKLMPALALIFHLINVANGRPSGQITIDCVERAAGWCDYLEQHARRIYEMALESSFDAARKLARKIQEGEITSTFDARDVYRKEWAMLDSKSTAEAACDILANCGWLKRSTIPEGGKTKTTYTVNPKVTSRGQS